MVHTHWPLAFKWFDVPAVPPPTAETLGAANAGVARTHNKPAVTKLFQDIRFLHLIVKTRSELLS
jgi:hypothetical protein